MGMMQRSTQPSHKTYTLREFISSSSNSSNLRYPSFCYQESDNDRHIDFVVKNTIDDYMYELKKLALKVELDDKEYRKYKYNPKLLAYDVYGSTTMYPFILKINDMCNIREFDIKILNLLRKDTLNTSLSSIYRTEKNDVMNYNSTHVI